jgi:hypothetical protein
LIDPAPSMLDGLPGTAQTAFVESMRDGADPRLGMHADQWRIQRGPLVGTVIFSQPYPEWHNLNVCYTGQGWVVDSAAYMRPGVGTDRTEVVLTRFKKGDGSAGYLFFSGVTADGSIVPPPGVGVLSQILERCANWLTPRVVFAGDTAMIQLWVTSQNELDDQAIAGFVDTLAAARDRFAKEMAAAKVDFAAK